MQIRLIVVPHCATEFNEQKRLQGQLDISLNQRGRQQAYDLSEMLAKFNITAIYSSDLSRCVETAEPLAASHQLKIILHSGLRGRHYGVIQGMRYTDIQDKFPYFYQRLKQRDPHIRFCTATEEGESLAEFEDRSMRAVMNCLARHEATKYSTANVVIITHGGVVDCIFRRAKRLPIDIVVNSKLYDPVQNFFLFDGGKFSACSPSWT